MNKRAVIRKTDIYALNILARPIGNLIKQGANLGNPYGALTYGVLDIFRNAAPKLKESKYVRLFEAGGFGFYTVKTIADIVSLIKMDFSSLIDLPFDASMALELGINTFSDYKGKNLKNDLIGIPNDLGKTYYFLFGEPINESNENPSKEDISKSKPFWKRKIINIKSRKNSLESKSVELV